MPYRIHNIALWLDEPDTLLPQRVATKLGVRVADLKTVRVVRSVLDARKKGSLRNIYSVEVEFAPGATPKRLPPDVSPAPEAPVALEKVKAPEQWPIIVGSGPAGLFC